MRFLLTALLWILTTVLLAVAIPSAWAQQHLVDEGGYAAFTQRAASCMSPRMCAAQPRIS